MKLCCFERNLTGETGSAEAQRNLAKEVRHAGALVTPGETTTRKDTLMQTQSVSARSSVTAPVSASRVVPTKGRTPETLVTFAGVLTLPERHSSSAAQVHHRKPIGASDAARIPLFSRSLLQEGPSGRSHKIQLGNVELGADFLGSYHGSYWPNAFWKFSCVGCSLRSVGASRRFRSGLGCVLESSSRATRRQRSWSAGAVGVSARRLRRVLSPSLLCGVVTARSSGPPGQRESEARGAS